MSKETSLFIILCNQTQMISLIQGFLGKDRISYEVFPSIKEWRLSEDKKPINGIFIDLKNLMTSELEDRSWFQQIEAAFPLFVMMPLKQESALKLAHKNDIYDTEDSIRKILKATISDSEPRNYREYIRYDRYHRVSLIRESDKQVIPAFVSNISVGGVFATANCFDFPLGVNEEVTIKFLDLNGIPSIHGSVRYIRGWEQSKLQPPGVGIQVHEKDLISLNQILYLRVGN